MAGSQDSFQKAMDAGHTAAWEQMWDQAADHYRRALDEFPDNPQGLTSLGLAFSELGRYQEAIHYYNRAAMLSRDDPLPLERVARLSEQLGNIEAAVNFGLRAADLYLQKRDVEKAIEDLAWLTNIAPDYSIAHSRLAMIYERLGRKSLAVREYLSVASLMQHSGDLEKALQAVNRAIQVWPENDEARQALVFLRDRRPLSLPGRSGGDTVPVGRKPDRQRAASEGNRQDKAGLDPLEEARKKALAALAVLLFEPDNETAMPARRRSLQGIVGVASGIAAKKADSSGVSHNLSQAVDMLSQGLEAQAAEELEKAMDAGIDHPAAYFLFGLSRFKRDQLESALRYLEKAAADPDYTLAARLLRGQINRKMSRMDEAVAEHLEALKLVDLQLVRADQADELRRLYEPLVAAQMHNKDVDAKVRISDRVEELLLRPNWQEQIRRARQEIPGGDDAGALVPLGEILAEASSNQVIESLGTVQQLARAGYLRAAMEEAFYALQIAPTYLPLHVYMAELLLNQGRVPEAIEKYSVAAQAYAARGEPKQAIEILRRVIELAPVEVSARRSLIAQLIACGQLAEAVRESVLLGDIFYNQAEMGEARKIYTEAAQLAGQVDDGNELAVKILHKIADIDMQSLDWRAALQEYEQIRSLQPGDRQARLYLIELNLRLAQEARAVAELENYLSHLAASGASDTAIDFLESFMEENPDRILVQRRLADLYIHSGRVQDALVHLNRIGEKLLKSGDRTRAANVVESILALDPPNKERYVKLLARLRSS